MSAGSRVRRVAAPSPRGSRPAWAGRHVGGEARAEVEVCAVLDLLEAACLTGVGLPRALDAVGCAIGGERGGALRAVAGALLLGAPWADAWSDVPPALVAAGRALRPAWDDGTPAAGLLRTAAEGLRRERRLRAGEEAARLGVRLVLPLGLCHLPAFVLVGLVPVMVAMTSDGLLG